MVFYNVFMSLEKNTVESLGSDQSSERLFSHIIGNNSPQGVGQIDINCKKCPIMRLSVTGS